MALKPPADLEVKAGSSPATSPSFLVALQDEAAALVDGGRNHGKSKAQLLAKMLFREALRPMGKWKMKAAELIIENMHGTPLQRHEVVDTTPEHFRGRSLEELEHFAMHGVFPAGSRALEMVNRVPEGKKGQVQ